MLCKEGPGFGQRAEPAFLPRGVRQQGLDVRIRGVRRHEQAQRPRRVQVRVMRLVHWLFRYLLTSPQVFIRVL